MTTTATAEQNSTPETAIFVSGLSVRVGSGAHERELLTGVDLEIGAGHFVAIIGASGCGKSTLLRTLAGVQSASEGRVLLAGHEVGALRDKLPLAIGYLPQFGAFHPELTVQEILEDAVRLRLPRSVSADVRDGWVRHIVEVARIEALLPQPYQTLSGGQRRRVALAEELIGDPAFLFLDELTSGLDAYSDRELMAWLRELAHRYSKTIVLVTHATYHLSYCDAVVLLHHGLLLGYGASRQMLARKRVDSVTELFALCESGAIPPLAPPAEPPPAPEPRTLRTAPPPSGFWQFPALLRRQTRLFVRERGQVWLHVALVLTFPALVAVFATEGLPHVRKQALQLETNILRTLQEQLYVVKESFQAASLISGLAMFQVVLLTLIGANNGAREIAREREILEKERRAGLSSAAYNATKFLQIAALSAVQAFWMAWFVKAVCGFPGDLFAQFGILFATTLAMSCTCLAISAASPSPERASLLAIYLVGFQLPLSGAALALPDWLGAICRPLIAAYWGWSGYLKTFETTSHYDTVRRARDTVIADYNVCLTVLAVHVVVAMAFAWFFVWRTKPQVR